MEQFDYLLQRELKERLQMLVESLSRGAPESYPDYCKLVGEIQGLQFALRALASIRSKITMEDDAA